MQIGNAIKDTVHKVGDVVKEVTGKVGGKNIHALNCGILKR